MTLTYTFPVRCFLCGHTETAMLMAFGARVNKASIRATDSITAVARVCRECGSSTPDTTARAPLTLTAESAAKVTAARRKKGWA